MWESIELREIRVFLTLADELHFGRTAERLTLTQSRVSQSLRELEDKLGERLVDRTSRRVELTDAGRRLLEDLRPAYGSLVYALKRADRAAQPLEGTLRIGLLTAVSGGPHLIEIIRTFEDRHPECEVRSSELPLTDRYGPLRRGEVELVATRLPLDQPDIVVGPVLSREPRVVGVARHHPLAAKTKVSLDDLADWEVADVRGLLPPELADSYAPPVAPSGKPIRRRALDLHDVSELLFAIAHGTIVHPTVSTFGAHFAHPDITYVPLEGLPASSSALAWRRRDRDPRLRAFLRVAREVLAE